MARSSHIVYRNPYGELQTHAEQELALLEEERERLVQRTAEIDERARQLREYLKAMTPLIAKGSGQALAEVGVTNLCRQVIDSTPRWVTAQEVRTTLKGIGVDISSYTNPMSVLHSILHRVAASYRDAEGKLYFGRRGLIRPPGLRQEEQSDGKENEKAQPKRDRSNDSRIRRRSPKTSRRSSLVSPLPRNGPE
jgi:hypothetical protein